MLRPHRRTLTHSHWSPQRKRSGGQGYVHTEEARVRKGWCARMQPSRLQRHQAPPRRLLNCEKVNFSLSSHLLCGILPQRSKKTNATSHSVSHLPSPPLATPGRSCWAANASHLQGSTPCPASFSRRTPQMTLAPKSSPVAPRAPTEPASPQRGCPMEQGPLPPPLPPPTAPPPKSTVKADGRNGSRYCPS